MRVPAQAVRTPVVQRPPQQPRSRVPATQGGQVLPSRGGGRPAGPAQRGNRAPMPAPAQGRGWQHSTTSQGQSSLSNGSRAGRPRAATASGGWQHLERKQKQEPNSAQEGKNREQQPKPKVQGEGWQHSRHTQRRQSAPAEETKATMVENKHEAAFNKFIDIVKDAYEHVKRNQQGQNAQYIPSLKGVDPSLFGISIETIDGKKFSIGDSSTGFTMQSVSKVFTYARALAKGQEKTNQAIGTDPSEQAFNKPLFDSKNRPVNAMYNIGAIPTAGLSDNQSSFSDKIDEAIKSIRAMGGGDESLSFDLDGHTQEIMTADNNRELLKELKKNPQLLSQMDLDSALVFYTALCSLKTDTESMSSFGATLANGGKNPKTQEQVIPEKVVEQLINVMKGSGTYNGSEAANRLTFGEVALKSGVSGVILGIIPGVGTITVFSPRLDENGNSVRGQEFFKYLADNQALYHLKRSIPKE